jgi:hypothetical protein
MGFICQILFTTSVLAAVAAAAPAADHAAPALWLYYPTNLLVDANVDRLEAIFQRAGKAGYSSVLISDSKFGHLGDLPEQYAANVVRVRRIAEREHLRLVPAVFPIGYSNDLLYGDPNLAEALPVKDALFVVHGGIATLVPDPPVTLKGGDMADLKAWDWKDDSVIADNGAARASDPKGNARLVQKVAVHPFRQYHLSVRVKTDHFTGTPEAKILVGGHDLSFTNLGVKPTQDWTEHHIVFNSLDHDQVAIYLGTWGDAHGTLWWGAAHLDEVGLVNLVRRPGAPLTIVGDDGKAIAEGGAIPAIADPRMGVVPWPGAYDVWHEPPTVKAALPDGTRLRMSYFHVVTIYDGQVSPNPYFHELANPNCYELSR